MRITMAQGREDYMNRIALFGLLALLAVTGANAQSGTHKCIEKNGRVTYSGSPCPGSVVANKPQASTVINIEDMTQGHADIVNDCTEVLSSAASEFWLEREQGTAGFNRYCPTFGFKAPLSQETRAFNDHHGKGLMAKLRERFTSVPSFSRVYEGGRRNPPEFSGAEQAMKQRISAKSKSVITMIPEAQPGLWKTRRSKSGRITQEESCDNPTAQFRSITARIPEIENLGCTVTSSNPAPRSVSIAFECPDKRGRGDISLPKGKTEIAIDSPSPQAVTFTLKLPSTDPEVFMATRLGECKQNN